MLQIRKAPIAKIWHVLEAKAIAALEKYVSVSTFDHVLTQDCLLQFDSLYFLPLIRLSSGVKGVLQ